MGATTLSTKGQIVIPHAIRARRGWKPGTRFEVEDRDGVLILRPVLDVAVATSLDELIGCAGYTGPARTLEEMDAAVARRAGAGA